MRVLESVLYAEDLAAAQAFYQNVLGLPLIHGDWERHLFFRCEGGVLILFKASKTVVSDAGVPTHGTIGAGHLAFAATRDEIEQWRQRLTERGIPIVQDVDWPNGAKSIYFRDPAGNVLEFATPDLWDLD